VQRLKTSILLLASLLAAGCKTTTSGEQPPAGDDAALEGDRPAVLVNPAAATREELERVVSDMLFGADVTLGQDALTQSSVLIIERKKIRSLENPPLSGRDLGSPERFRLYTTGTQCVLVHESDHARYELLDVECVPEEESRRLENP
jgi:predicted small secreted protein